MGVVAIACLSHLAAAQLLPPWWTPDLTLVGLLVAVPMAPQRWYAAAAFAGGFMMIWAVRDAVPIGVAYGVVAWTCQALAQRWDLGDARVGCGVVAVYSIVMTCGLLWLDDLWSVVLVGWLVIHVATTTLAAFLVLRRVGRGVSTGRGTSTPPMSLQP